MATEKDAAVVTSFAANPLTTTFSRPDDCNGIYRSGFLSIVDGSSTCLPSGFKNDAYFSPGLVCPAGYVSACHDHTGVASITTVTCCPALADLSITMGCVTTSTLKGTFSTLFCTWIAPPKSAPAHLPITLSGNGVTSTVKAAFASPGGLNAFGVRMVYEASDLATAASADSTSADSTSEAVQSASTTIHVLGSATSGASQPDTQPGSTASIKSSSGGLSTGAKVAIGVVVPVVVLAVLAGILFWLWRKRRRGNDEKAAAAAELPSSTTRPVELPGDQQYR